MTSRLNPDGAKIRALRIQRGWTQEQLAEIAGVSTRTVQRAEAAARAAFDTLRAVAGAFETDFDQLLRTDPCPMPGPEPQTLPASAQATAPIPESREKPSRSQPAHPVPRNWTMFPVVATALAAGLLAGGIVVYRFYPPVDRGFPTPRSNPAVAERAGTSEEPGRHDANTVVIPRELPAISSAVSAATIPGRKSDRGVEKPGYRQPAAAAEVVHGADLAPQTMIPEAIQSPSLDLPLPRDPAPILANAEMPGGWNPGSAHTGGFAQKDQGSGAVRQSIGQAARKTSGAFAKVSASIRRAF